MEDVKNFVPDFVEQEQEREIIIKLGHMVTNRIPYKLKLKKLTKYDPEYWGLSLLLTDEQAEIALKMGLRTPRTLPQIVKLTGMTEEKPYTAQFERGKGKWYSLSDKEIRFGR